MIWTKKLAIRFFKLKDISDLLYHSKTKQKEIDEKYWKEILNDSITSLKREHELELQERDSTIMMLEQHIKSYKEKEKEVANKEFLARKQLKENDFIAQNVTSKMFDFVASVSKIHGEMLGIKDTVEANRKRIERRE